MGEQRELVCRQRSEERSREMPDQKAHVAPERWKRESNPEMP